jgi:hypothetical protein
MSNTLSSRFAAHRSLLVVITGAIVLLLAADLVYVAFGEAYVARAHALGHRATLQVIIPTWVPEPLEAYHAAADRLVIGFNLIVLGLLVLLIPGEFCQQRVGRVYDAVIRAADLALRRKAVALTALACVTVVVLAGLALAVFRQFPNSGDEYCYLYQAETWNAGRIWNPAHPLQEFFQFDHVRVLDGRVFSVFPPGWPFVLLLAMKAGVPLWLVNPVLGAVVIVAIFLIGRGWYSERVALLAAVTTLVSAFFLLNSASFYAHTATLLAALVMVDASLRGLEQRSLRHAVLAGAAFGFAFTARFFTALVIGLPLGVVFLRQHWRDWRFALGFTGGAAPFLAAFLWYNHALMGTWFTLPMNGFEAYDMRWFPPDLFSRGTKLLFLNLLGLLMWVPAAILPAWVLAMKGKDRLPRNGLLGSAVICLVAGYFFYVDDAGNRYGPRYYFEALAFIVLPATALVFSARSWAGTSLRGRWLFYLYGLSVVLSLPLLVVHSMGVAQVVWERSDLYRLARHDGVVNAVVFVATPAGTRARMEPVVLTRNGVDDRASVIYLLDRGADNARVVAYYPSRSFYRYRYDVRARTGSLERLDPAALLRSSRGEQPGTR